MSDSTVRSSKQDSRHRLVTQKVDQWREELLSSASIDQLLHPTKRCPLDATEINKKVLSQLVAGEPVAIEQALSNSKHTMVELWDLADQIEHAHQELGIQTGHFAFGFAQWAQAESKPPSPVLLYPIEIRRQADTLLMTLDNDPIVNPVLIEHLATAQGLDVSVEHFPIPDNTNPQAVLDRVTSQLTRAAASVEGFDIQPSSALCVLDLSRFKLATDLATGESILSPNTIIAALSGDPLARRAVSADSAAPSTPIDTRPIATEFHVLDSNAEQSRIVDSAINGESLAVQAPCGTGKSHTIANLIATLTARHQRVLFVSQKRRAIESVMQQLDGVGLSDIFLDVEDGAAARTRTLDRIRQRLEAATPLSAVDTAPVHEQLTHSRAALLGYHEAIHGRRSPWNMSVFEARCFSTRIRPGAAAESRFDAQSLSRLDPAMRQRIARDLKSYVDLGGFSISSDTTAWSGAELDSDDTCDEAASLAQRTAQAWTTLTKAMNALTDVTGPIPAASLHEWTALIAFLHGIEQTLEVFSPAVWDAPLSDWIAATGTAKWRNENGIRLSWRRRRRILRKVRLCWIPRSFDPARAHRILIEALAQRKRWHRMELASHIPLPDIPVASARRALDAVDETLEPLARLFPTSDPRSWPTTVLGDWLTRLAQDQRYPSIIRRLRRLRFDLEEAGLAKLLTEMDLQRPTTQQAQDMFMSCFAQSLLDYLAHNDSRSSDYHLLPLDQTVRNFVHHDIAHQKLNATRVLHRAMTHFQQIAGQETNACRLVTKQLASKTNRSSFRRLLAENEPVITTAFPCIAVSPRNIADTLPPESVFDVVIFDDAGSLATYDAVSAIARARRTVVFGDKHQLPPQGHDRTEATSVLDALSQLLPVHTLRQHYRSHDHRLIGFAQQHMYKDRVLPLPGRGADGCLSHVVAGPGLNDVVDRAVDLAVDHADNHSDVSLGIVTDTEALAHMVQQRLTEESQYRPKLREMMDRTDPESFVVRAAHWWQGQDRDVAIVAYTSADAELGAGTDAARTLVALASSRGRFRLMTVGPARDDVVGHDSPIHALVDYTASGGLCDEAVREGDGFNPFEADIAQRLRKHHIAVRALRDAAGQRIGLAAMHPRRRNEAVLAIESDGAGISAANSVRDRHRLRTAWLQNSQWSVHWVWSVDWWHAPDTEVDKIVNAYSAALERLVSQPKPLRRRQARPDSEKSHAQSSSPAAPIFVTGRPITTYRHEDLVTLVAWICKQNDTTKRSVVQSRAREILGFKRRGRRIDAALDKAYGAAVKQLRSTRASTD